MKKLSQLSTKAAKILLLMAGLGGLGLSSTFAQQIFNFPLNEGSGVNFFDTVNSLKGSLAPTAIDTNSDTVSLSTDSPSGLAGDGSYYNLGNGFIIADDRTNAVLNITNGPITTEAWVRINPNFGHASEGIVSYGGSYKMGLRGGVLVFTLLGKADITNSLGGIIPVDQWTHLAAAWQPGSGVTFYIGTNANFVANTNTTARPLQNNYLSIGSEGFSNPLDASFDRVRIHNAVLTAGQIDADPAVPAPTLPGTLVSYNFNEASFPVTNSLAPALPADYALPVIAAAIGPVWTNNTPTGATNDFALEFDGTRRATVPDPGHVINLGSGNGDYTLESWVKLPLGFNPAARMIMYQYEGNPGFAFSINTGRTLHTTTFGLNDINGAGAVVPNDNQWHHVAVVHQNGVQMRFYIDGVLSATTAYTRGPGTRTTFSITLGASSAGANLFTGTLDRMRFTSGALTPDQFDFPAVPGSPVITSQPVGSTVIAGSNLTLSSTAYGNAPLSFQWLLNSSGILGSTVTVPGATSTNLTLNNIQIANQGFYSMRASNSINTAVTKDAKLLVQTRTNYLAPLWNLTPGSRPYLTAGTGGGQTDNLERGLAYNPVTDHLLLVARATSPTLKGIYVLNAANGSDVGQLPTNSLITSAATFILSRIGVADDGAIYAANFGTAPSGTTPAFNVYRWASESAQPTIAFQGDAASGLPSQQWGKNMAVRGSGTNTQILLDCRNAVLALLTTTNGSDFQYHILTSNAGGDAFGNGIVFGTGNTFWGKLDNGSLYRMAFDINAGTATVLNTYPLIQDQVGNFAISLADNLFAGVEMDANAPNRVNLYDITDLSKSPILIDRANTPTDNLNSTKGGNTAFGRARLFALDTNNGLMAYTLPSFNLSITASGSNVVLSWPATATGYILESTTSISGGTWTPVTYSVQGGSNVATQPLSGTAKFYRLRK